MYKQINSNSVFFFSEDMELMFGVLNILEGEEKHQLCTKLYGEDYIGALKKKYHFLVEVAGTFNKFSFNCILEHLLNYPLDNFHLSMFRDYLLNLDTLGKRYLEEFFGFSEELRTPGFQSEMEGLTDRITEDLTKHQKAHDPVTIAYLIDPSVVTTKAMYTEIDIRSTQSYGRTNCDYFGYLKKEPNSYVGIDIDVDKFWNIIENGIKLY